MNLPHATAVVPRVPSHVTRREALVGLAALTSSLVLARGWIERADDRAGHVVGSAPYRYSGGWGGPGVGSSQFRMPWHLAVSSQGAILVADTDNRRVQRFAPDGRYLSEFRTAVPSTAELLRPLGVASGPDDTISVSDGITNRVLTFSASGDFLEAWGNGPLESALRAPGAIAIDRLGQFFVCDTGNHRLRRLTPSRGLMESWGVLGNAGELHSPSGIASGPDNTVVVADTGNDRLLKFAADGALLAQWGGAGNGGGKFNRPGGVAVDAAGTVMVADAGNHRIQFFTSDGRYSGQWGTPGTGAGQFAFPWGIAVDATGVVYVADTGNHRIQTFEPA